MTAPMDGSTAQGDKTLAIVAGLITVGKPVLEWVDIGGVTSVYRVKTHRGYHVDLQRMGFNWRLWCIPALAPFWTPGRFWCYTGVGARSFAVTVLAAARWDVADDTEPEGWNKNGQTGEYLEYPLGGA